MADRARKAFACSAAEARWRSSGCRYPRVVSTEAWADKCIAAICTAARSGRVGDGKIFCYEVGRAVRIRTGEEGVDAIQPGPPETDEDE